MNFPALFAKAAEAPLEAHPVDKATVKFIYCATLEQRYNIPQGNIYIPAFGGSFEERSEKLCRLILALIGAEKPETKGLLAFCFRELTCFQSAHEWAAEFEPERCVYVKGIDPIYEFFEMGASEQIEDIRRDMRKFWDSFAVKPDPLFYPWFKEPQVELYGPS